MTWKRAGIAAGLLAAVLALLAFGLFPQDPVRRLVEGRLSSALGGSVRIRGLHVVPGRLAADIDGLTVDAPAYSLSVEHVSLRSRFETVAGGPIHLDFLRVDKPFLTVKPPSATKEASGPLPSVRIEQLDVADGRVSVPASEVTLERLEAHGSVGGDALDLTVGRIAWQKPAPAEANLEARLRLTSALALTIESARLSAVGLQADVSGEVGRLDAPKADLTVTAHATLPEALALAPPPAADVRGQLALTAQLRGTLESPEAEARLSSEGLVASGYALDAAEVVARYTGDATLADLTGRALGGTFTGHGELHGKDVVGRFSARGLRLPEGRVDLDAEARGALEGRLKVGATASVEGAREAMTYTLTARADGGVAMPSHALDLSWTAEGTVTAGEEKAAATARGTAKGAWPPAVVGELEGTATLPRAAGPLVVPLRGSVRSQGAIARVEASATPGSGQVNLGVDLESGTPRHVTATGQGLDLGLLDPQAGGTLAVELDLREPLGRAAGEGRAHVDAVTWAGTSLGPADVSLNATNGVLDARFEMPELRLSGTARREGPNAPTLTGTVRLDKTPVALLAQAAGQPGTTGEVEAEGTFTVPVKTPARSSLHATVSGVTVAHGDYEAATEAPFTLDLDAERARIAGLRAVGHGASLGLDGSVGLGAAGPLDLRTRFSADLGKLPLPEGTTAKGLIAGELAVTGTSRRPLAHGEIDVAAVGVAGRGVPTIGLPKAVATIDGETLVLPPTDLAIANGTLTVEGRLPVAAVWPAARARKDAVAAAESARLDLRLKDVSVGELMREAAPETASSLTALASGQAHVEGGLASLAEIAGTARLELTDVRMSDLPLTITPIDFRLQRGLFEARDVTLTAEDASLKLGGSVNLVSGAIEGAGVGRMDLRAISPFVPETSLSGLADLDLRVAGTLSAPQAVGHVDLADGQIRARAFPHALTDVKGRVVFDQQALRLENVSAQLAGGSLTATGGAALDKAGVHDTNLKIEGRELNLRYPEGLRSRTTVDMTLTGKTGAFLLAGNVNADRGRYDIDQVLRDAIRGGPAEAPVEPSPLLRSIALDVQVTTDNPVVVRHDLINVEATGTMNVRGDAETPAPFGRFELAEGGTIEIQGHEFQVESGSLTYTGTWNPEVSLRLTATIHSIDDQQDYAVVVTASGNLEDPKLTFTSEPGNRTEAEILSLISTGRLDTGATESVGRLAGNQLAILMTSRLTSGLARGLGLDRVSLQPELLSREKDPGARFTFEKQLTQRLRLIQSYSLNDAEARFTQVEADLPKDVKVIGQRDDDGLLTAGVGQKMRFGGPKKPKAKRRERPAPVTTVTLEGAPPQEEAELRKLIKLEPGKRGGIGRLQDDAERIRLALVKKGYIEAETSARLEKAAATITVRPGAHYTTRVDGATAPSKLDDALRDSLDRDEALDRGRALVLRELREGGYLRAKVKTAVEKNGTESVLVFKVEPGTRYTTVTILFPGSDRLGRKELEKAGGGAGGFVAEPETALAGVRKAYAEALRLAATAGPVAVEESGSAITITVPVNEGPPAKIAALHIEGSTLPAGEAEKESKLEPGEEYDEDRVVAAVTRLREHYLGLGYPGVRVAPEVKLAPPDLELTFRVDEGQRLAVGSIEIKGRQRTSEGLIRSRLHFKEGDPLDVRELTHAERRLLELTVFSRVSITYTRENPSKVTVDLQELGPLYAAYQVRYNDEEHLTGQIDAERGNLFGRGIALGGRLRLGGDIEEERVSLRVPSLFHGDLVSSLFRISEDLPIDETDPNSEKNNSLERGFDLQQKVPLSSITNLLFGYRYKRSTLTSPILIEPITVSISAVDGSFVRDSRDFALDATRGAFLSFNIEYSPEALGSDLQFVKTFAQSFFYKELKRAPNAQQPSLIWAQAFRTGLAWTFHGQELIPDERFTAGGATSVRGYATDSLGPVDPFLGDPLGGEATIVMNQELRYRHRSGLGGVLFWDVGNVWAHVGDIGFDFKHSVGFGVRWASPVGLLRFDLGHALDPPPGEKSWRYYFSLGQSF